uniref:EF-hand domain-containing protein n=1 Tax=Salix viminalis TaxID=40686 RepID=A0A6N2L308_SALVM
MSVLASLGLKQGRTLEDCKRMIRKVDVDGDGMVDYREFKKLMKGGGFSALERVAIFKQEQLYQVFLLRIHGTRLRQSIIDTCWQEAKQSHQSCLIGAGALDYMSYTGVVDIVGLQWDYNFEPTRLQQEKQKAFCRVETNPRPIKWSCQEKFKSEQGREMNPCKSNSC